ncbi:MAG: hypothetical protein II238_01235 [Alphaproteobacteria bacterium]|nr:hypothetical protein [Alphaproteobacteria bacterium]
MAKARYTAKQIQQRYNLTPKQYRSQYEVFRRRVENFNRATGSNYSAINEFNYAKVNPNSETIKAINAMSSIIPEDKKISLKMERQATEYVGERFRGLRNNAPMVERAFQRIGQNGYTAKDFAKFAEQYAEELKNQRKQDPLIASDAVGTEPINEDNLNALEEIQGDYDLIFDE